MSLLTGLEEIHHKVSCGAWDSCIKPERIAHMVPGVGLFELSLQMLTFSNQMAVYSP